MNEGLTIFLNLDEQEAEENEKLISRVDELLMNFGIKYSGFQNMYVPAVQKDRDRAVFAACHALRDTVWLKDKLAYTPIMNLTNACSPEQIKTDHMTKPNAAKAEYYENYYRETHKLAHGIVVDETGQLRDGYISYILAKKYGIQADIYEAFAAQPVRKVVRGQHVVKDGDKWKLKNQNVYYWNYMLKTPVVPGDILKVRTSKGKAYICVRRVEYVTGKEFCNEHKNVIKHMKERLQEI